MRIVGKSVKFLNLRTNLPLPVGDFSDKMKMWRIFYHFDS